MYIQAFPFICLSPIKGRLYLYHLGKCGADFNVLGVFSLCVFSETLLLKLQNYYYHFCDMHRAPAYMINGLPPKT